ncbi:hypothetical protein K7G98_09630, partial [Saccharothrix sp. MB29]|nr:hypothetical protein [Saccharothrix sp. MB29]
MAFGAFGPDQGLGAGLVECVEPFPRGPFDLAEPRSVLPALLGQLRPCPVQFGAGVQGDLLGAFGPDPCLTGLRACLRHGGLGRPDPGVGFVGGAVRAFPRLVDLCAGVGLCLLDEGLGVAAGLFDLLHGLPPCLLGPCHRVGPRLLDPGFGVPADLLHGDGGLGADGDDVLFGAFDGGGGLGPCRVALFVGRLGAVLGLFGGAHGVLGGGLGGLTCPFGVASPPFRRGDRRLGFGDPACGFRLDGMH